MIAVLVFYVAVWYSLVILISMQLTQFD
jgi:hypothetical protein